MFTPFRGWRYDPERVDDLGAVTSPPYDIIDPAEHLELEHRSPYNIVRVLLAGAGDPTYQGAAEELRRWKSEGILRRDTTPRFYLYTMDYLGPGGDPRHAIGVLGALELVELGDRVVPHEETMAKHRADRLAVLNATQANLDVIIALSSAPELALLLTVDGPPDLEFVADGITHRLYDVTDPDRIAAIEKAVAGHGVSIADGHHRYTTALGYRRDRDLVDGTGPWDAILTMMCPAEGSGLTIGPYHRVFDRLEFDPARVEDAFAVSPAPPLPPTEPGNLVIVTGDDAWHLAPRTAALEPLPGPWRVASPAVARELLYPRLGVTEEAAGYVADAVAAVAMAHTPPAAALLVAPVTEHAIAEAGDLGIRFPQKTTYFNPKPRAGLVIRTFDDD